MLIYYQFNLPNKEAKTGDVYGSKRHKKRGREMAMFMQGSKREFYRLLGLSYGFIFVEDCQQLFVMNLEQGRTALRGAVKNGLLTGDEAQEIEASMVEAGLPENMQSVLNVVEGFKIPEGFIPSFSFKLCEGCAVNIPHGYVRNE